MRKLPLEALDFLDAGAYPQYQLLRIDREDVTVSRAAPVAAFIVDWYCDGRLLALQIAPAPGSGWREERWPPAVVLEVAKGVPLPEITGHRYNKESWFVEGGLRWPSEGRGMSFEYTDGLTDVIFNVIDRQTGEDRRAGQTGWSCH